MAGSERIDVGRKKGEQCIYKSTEMRKKMEGGSSGSEVMVRKGKQRGIAGLRPVLIR